MKTSFILLTAATLLAATSGPTQQKFKETKKGIYTLIEQKGGPTLGYSLASGVKILTIGGFKFKDLRRLAPFVRRTRSRFGLTAKR